MKCHLTECKQEFTPTAPHQKFHSDKCRFRHHQVRRQRLIKRALKLEKEAK
jgi:hypothetical protein